MHISILLNICIYFNCYFVSIWLPTVETARPAIQSLT